MPKSKRDRAVTLSKTKKKGREHKENIVNSIRDAVEQYNSMYVFSFENMRNLKFKQFREQLKSTSRFFLGSNKVMQVALGRSASDEIRTGLHKVAKLLRGDSGLCVTNMSKEEIQRLPLQSLFFTNMNCIWLFECSIFRLLVTYIITYGFIFGRIFDEYEDYDFARTGSIATETMELKEGPLDQFTHEMEPFLRKQGMPVRLNRGVVELVGDFVVCEEGKPISPESSRILRLMGMKMATFKLHLICRWSPEDFEVYQEGLEGSDIESS
ncbi:Ribosomal protein L10/acidic P0 [Cynara cardunculus var. scolymus]|uniref:Ribosome assembly factor mrt4 n=1 Tax=Cynara cardunculus var. scolymus TaxID=59895 RepID=A0A103YKV1_CYNCS|nr:Ribosomal protein L10/acidic P0 [Cynara cardunculus var. scolymus]